MEVCSVHVSLGLNPMERGAPQNTAVLWPSKFFKATRDRLSDHALSPIPVNLAAPDPDGQWMAICSATLECVLIPSAVSAVQG